MFVLGIDPGLTRCGYGAVRLEEGVLQPVAAGVLATPVEAPLAKRLAALSQDLKTLLADLKPDAVAVEHVFFQTNVKTAMSVGQASGLALVAAIEAGCDVAQYTSNEVKQAISGYGGASKEQLQKMVQSVLHLSSPPRPADAADALALAICHLTMAPRRARINQALGATT